MINDKREIKGCREMLDVMVGKKQVEECKVLGKKPKKKIQHEAKEQESLFIWAKMQENVYPELKLLFHIANGGSRHKLEAYALKRQGVKSGIPDLMLPVSRGGYHGLFIELKVGKNKTSTNQDWWLDELCNQGYRCEVSYGFEKAKETILQYLKLRQNSR